jgi:hypothetical protein
VRTGFKSNRLDAIEVAKTAGIDSRKLIFNQDVDIRSNVSHERILLKIGNEILINLKDGVLRVDFDNRGRFQGKAISRHLPD